MDDKSAHIPEDLPDDPNLTYSPESARYPIISIFSVAPELDSTPGADGLGVEPGDNENETATIGLPSSKEEQEQVRELQQQMKPLSMWTIGMKPESETDEKNTSETATEEKSREGELAESKIDTDPSPAEPADDNQPIDEFAYRKGDSQQIAAVKEESEPTLLDLPTGEGDQEAELKRQYDDSKADTLVKPHFSPHSTQEYAAIEAEELAEEVRPMYSLVKKLGQGGCGEVWQAHQESLGRMVAVKKMRADLRKLLESDQTQRVAAEGLFRQEALTTALLDHPNIVPIYDLGADDEGSPLLAMKMVRGKPWDHVLYLDFKELSPADFLSKHLPILVDVAQAVAFAHSRGIVHRDLKPAQVMIGEFGETLLMDWGLSIAYDRAALLPAIPGMMRKGYLPTTETATNPAGTPSLMAPEQTLENDASYVGPWTDVYLLGGCLYYLLTGRYPHQAGNATESMKRAAIGDVIPPHQRNPDRDIPGDLEFICLEALAKVPEDRTESAQAFIENLQDYLSGTGNRDEADSLLDAADDMVEPSGLKYSYSHLSEAMAKIERAKVLWPDHPRMVRVRNEVLEVYARLAMDQGDLTLAKLQLEQMQDTPAKQGLAERLELLEKQKEDNERLRRVTTTATFGLLFLVIVGALISRNNIAHERDEGERARKDAVESKQKLETMMGDLEARLNELDTIYQVNQAIDETDDIASFLSSVVDRIPDGFEDPVNTRAQIRYDGKFFQSKDFRTGPHEMTTPIMVNDKPKGRVDVYITRERSHREGDPFSAEEHRMLDNIANLVSKAVGKLESEAKTVAAMRSMRERIKELNTIYGVSDLIREADDLVIIFKKTAALLEPGWKYPEIARARVTFDGIAYHGENFEEGPWKMSADIRIGKTVRGKVEVFYLEERPEADEGPFVKEERDLIDRVAKLLSEEVERTELEKEMLKEMIDLQLQVKKQTMERDKTPTHENTPAPTTVPVE
jgi:serine/threonine protein kinase